MLATAAAGCGDADKASGSGESDKTVTLFAAAGPATTNVPGTGRQGRLNKVALGEADAALVYRAAVQSAGTKVHGIDFPEPAKAINDYPIATRTKVPQPALAKEFVQLVVSPQRKGALAAAGFEAP
jgi:ABC-type molybdate transport system substrate-binding protein